MYLYKFNTKTYYTFDQCLSINFPLKKEILLKIDEFCHVFVMLFYQFLFLPLNITKAFNSLQHSLSPKSIKIVFYAKEIKCLFELILQKVCYNNRQEIIILSLSFYETKQFLIVFDQKNSFNVFICKRKTIRTSFHATKK